MESRFEHRDIARNASGHLPRLSSAFALCFVLVSLVPGLGLAKGEVNIVTTTPDLAAVAKEIGGVNVKVTAIAKGNQNLHTVPAKPSFMMLARKADLWIRVGLQLEVGYERPILQGSRNRKILFGQPGFLDASVGIDRLEVPDTILRESLGLSLGDVHPQGNPHYWLDPFRIRIVGRSIAAKLERLDPDRAGDYRANYENFVQRIDEASFGQELVKAVGGERLWELENSKEMDAYLDDHPESPLGGWLGRMRPLRNAKIVTYHRSWTYFVDRFALEVVAEVEPKPGIPPGPRHVSSLIRKMKDEHIHIILMEPFYSRRAPEKIASETGATIVVATISVGGQAGVNNYFALIENAVSRLLDAAEKQGMLRSRRTGAFVEPGITQ